MLENNPVGFKITRTSAGHVLEAPAFEFIDLAKRVNHFLKQNSHATFVAHETNGKEIIAEHTLTDGIDAVVASYLKHDNGEWHLHCVLDARGSDGGIFRQVFLIGYRSVRCCSADFLQSIREKGNVVYLDSVNFFVPIGAGTFKVAVLNGVAVGFADVDSPDKANLKRIEFKTMTREQLSASGVVTGLIPPGF